jgi:phosphoribosylformylglycinamidine cyclo-ligase
MYQVFNMGHRLEVFTDPAAADEIIRVAGEFRIDARVVGHVEAAPEKRLVLKRGGEEIVY